MSCEHLVEVAKHLGDGGRDRTAVGKAIFAVQTGKCMSCGEAAAVVFLPLSTGATDRAYLKGWNDAIARVLGEGLEGMDLIGFRDAVLALAKPMPAK